MNLLTSQEINSFLIFNAQQSSKGRITKAELRAASERHKAVFRPTVGSKEGTFHSYGFSAVSLQSLPYPVAEFPNRSKTYKQNDYSYFGKTKTDVI